MVTPRPVSVPHIHARFIKAWADGETIEYKGRHADTWRELLPPGSSQVSWGTDVEYRIKQYPTEWFAGIRVSATGMPFFTHAQLSRETIRDVWAISDLTGIAKITMDPTTNQVLDIAMETIQE